jgi:hypothetical protein
MYLSSQWLRIKKKQLNAFLQTELSHLETLEESRMTSGVRVSSPTYSKIQVY